MYKENDIVTHIKINRLKWAGHVIRMEEQSPTRRVLVAVVEGRRQRGRRKLRWEDGVMEDARKLGERNWRNAARKRDSWQKLLKKVLAQRGRSANDDNEYFVYYVYIFQSDEQHPRLRLRHRLIHCATC